MRFMVIASPRTGSTHLVTTLSEHPEILCNGNIFHPRGLQLFWPKSELTADRKKVLRRQRENNPSKFLENVFDTGFGKRHIGFKIFRGERDDLLNQLLTDNTVRKIVLFRRNILANYASRLSAKQSGQYAAHQERTGPEGKIVFEHAQFRQFSSKYLGFYRRVTETMKNTGQNFYFINYDDISEPLILSGLVGFVGADMNAATSASPQNKHLVKQGSNDILSRFANEDVVREFLEQNGLKHWANEGATSFSELMEKDDLPESLAEGTTNGNLH